MYTFGTLDLRDTTIAQLRLAELGQDRLAEMLDAELRQYEALWQELFGLLAFSTTEYSTRYGATGGGEMLPADEYSRQDFQKSGGGYSLGFPLSRYQFAIGWTKDFFKRKTVRDLTVQVDNAFRADLRRSIRDIKFSLFNPVNYDFEDEFKGTLKVKALINGDGTPLAPYDGVIFASDHNHYLVSGNTTFNNGNAIAMETHLTEHGHIGNLVLYINSAQEASVRACADFTPAQSPFIINPLGTFARVSDNNDYTRIIGRLRGMEVRIRTWMPAGYLFAFNEYGNNSDQNPLARRMSDIPEDNGLHIAGEDDRFPLHAQFMERWMGFGAYNRTNGVIMQVTTNGTYAAPTFS